MVRIKTVTQLSCAQKTIPHTENVSDIVCACVCVFFRSSCCSPVGSTTKPRTTARFFKCAKSSEFAKTSQGRWSDNGNSNANQTNFERDSESRGYRREGARFSFAQKTLPCFVVEPSMRECRLLPRHTPDISENGFKNATTWIMYMQL